VHNQFLVQHRYLFPLGGLLLSQYRYLPRLPVGGRVLDDDGEDARAQCHDRQPARHFHHVDGHRMPHFVPAAAIHARICY
jgi:hypothetical protein